MGQEPSDHPFTPDLFERFDDADDADFYAAPRKVVHLDEGAIGIVRQFFSENLPDGAEILDLMSSWRSHYPAGLGARRVVGLGMNAEEMADNPDLDEHLVHDLNRDPRLPFPDETFDAVTLTVSMQYLTHPIEVFREIRRVLRPGGVCIVVLSSRCFFPKAVKIWQQCQNMRERMELAMAYFRYATGFIGVLGVDLRPGAAQGEDPVVSVLAYRDGEVTKRVHSSTGWRRR